MNCLPLWANLKLELLMQCQPDLGPLYCYKAMSFELKNVDANY